MLHMLKDSSHNTILKEVTEENVKQAFEETFIEWTNKLKGRNSNKS